MLPGTPTKGYHGLTLYMLSDQFSELIALLNMLILHLLLELPIQLHHSFTFTFAII